MKIKQYTQLLLCFLSLSALCSSIKSVKAELVTVNFSGNLQYNYSSDHTGFMAAAGVNSGDLVTGSFTYDPTTPALNSYLGADNINEFTYANYNLKSYSWNIDNKVAFTSLNGTVEVMNSTAQQAYPGWYFHTGYTGDMTDIQNGNSIYIDGINYTHISHIPDIDNIGLSTNLPTQSQLSQGVAIAQDGQGHGYDFFRVQGGDITNGQYAMDWSLSNQQWSVQSVPEPSTYALFGLGALVLVIGARKTKQMIS